jgi:hypothetical protein
MFMLLNMAILMKTLFIIFEPHFDVLIIYTKFVPKLNYSILIH